MTVPQEIIEFLKLREGYTNKVYRDTRGNLTVGLGHKLDRQERNHYGIGATLSEAALQVWVQADTSKAYEAALSQAAELRVTNEAFIKVLTSVNFQLGTDWNHTFGATWTMLLNHEWEQAANNLSSSSWIKQTPVRVKDFQEAILSVDTAEPVSAETFPARKRKAKGETPENANLPTEGEPQNESN